MSWVIEVPAESTGLSQLQRELPPLRRRHPLGRTTLLWWPFSEIWAFYHDMNGLLAVAREALNVLFVVINNDGGGIFHMLPIREHEPEFTRFFATPHGLDFGQAAALYGIPYRLLAESEGLSKVLGDILLEPGPRILEIRTDRAVNHRRHREVIEAVAHAVRADLELF